MLLLVFSNVSRLTNHTKHNTLIATGGNMNPNNRPTAKQLLTSLFLQAKACGCKTEIIPIWHETKIGIQLRIADQQPGLDKGTFLLTAGIHGTEVAGPLTIYNHFPEILKMTRAAELKLVCYPLMNPAGYDNGTDRNPDEPKLGNNDFLRYRQFDGTWTWDHPPGGCANGGWLWSSDPVVGIQLPAETLVMHEFLKQEDWANIKVALDIHQDYLTPDLPDGAYHYTFNDVSRYEGIIDNIGELTTVLGNHKFGYDRDNPEAFVLSDKNGCIPYFHDGSLS